jgi:DNA polymerase I-like protein with 3'-5' exonuclease and polymerase domains
MKLPPVSGLLVALDSESSGLFNDDGARISVVSAAWRDPASSDLVSIAVPFDQGSDFTCLPCGPKQIPATHSRRLAKWAAAYPDLTPAQLYSAPNRSFLAWDRLVSWLSRQQLIMHNGKHDSLQFYAGQRDRPHGGNCEFQSPHPPWDGGHVNLMPALVWDSMLASGQLWPGYPIGLKDTAVRLHIGKALGIEEGDEAAEQEALGPWKGPRTDPRFDLIPWFILGPYAARDAQLTYLLYEYQQSQLNDQTLIRCEEEFALLRTLYGMEVRGVGFDAPGCRRELSKLDSLIQDAAAAVPFKGGTGRPTSPSAIKYFFGAPKDGGLGYLPYSDKITSHANPQVDEEVIGRLIKAGAPGASEYAHYQELSSARSKWYAAFPALAGPDGRLRTTHRQGRVVSGRLSVERFQAQALPHDYQIPPGIEPIRSFLGNDDGYEHWEADASQAEIRVATKVAQEKSMLRALRAGVDSHDAACKLMFFPDKSVADAKLMAEWERYRQVAKRCNLGILYGIGAGGLRTQILKFTGYDYSVDQCREWISDYKNAFPAFARALWTFSQMATESGFVRLCTGKVRKFADYEPVHKAFNQRVQGDVSEGMRITMVRFDREYPGLLLLQIHDSLVCRIPVTDVEGVVPAMSSAIVSTFSNLFSPVPFKADVKRFGSSAYFEEVAA